MYNKLDKVRALRDDKLQPGIVTDVIDKKGFRGYQYQHVWVEFVDGEIKEYKSFALIDVISKQDEDAIKAEKKAIKDKK